MDRVKKVTLPDGSSPFYLDGAVIPTGMPQLNEQFLGAPVGVDGNDWQKLVQRQFSFTFIAQVQQNDNDDLRAYFDALIGENRDSNGNLVSQGIMGRRNRRFYLNDDRYWFVRHTGTLITRQYPSIGDYFVLMEFYLLVLDPFLRDNEGTLYRAW